MAKRKHVTYSRDRDYDYTAEISNLDVISLEITEYELDSKLEKVRDKLNEIRKNCIHDYRFTTSGMHTDFFKCVICGDSTER